LRRRPFSRNVVRALPFFGNASLSYVFFMFVSAGLMFVSAIKPRSFDGLRAGTADVFAPVLEFVSQPLQRGSLFVQDVTGLAALQAENEQLREENVRLREWYQTAMLLEAENKSLRELLNVKLDPQHSFITARVIADSGNAYVKSLLLSAGKSDGVEKGQAVLSGEGLVGRIVEAGQRTSRILLVNDVNSRVPVVVQDTLQHAVMAGTNGTYPRLIHLSQDTKILEGARIMTSGYGGVFPPGLPVGKVVLKKDGVRRVALFADLDRMLYVRCVKKADEQGLNSGNGLLTSDGF